MKEKISIALQYFAVVLILGTLALIVSISPKAQEARERRAWRQEVADYRSRPVDTSSVDKDVEESEDVVEDEGTVEEMKVVPLAYDQLWIQMPARPEIAQRRYNDDLSVDDALGEIFEEIKNYDPRGANGGFNISVKGGDNRGSLVVSEIYAAGDSGGSKFRAYRYGVKQLEISHGSYYDTATFTVDDEEYFVNPRYGESFCEGSVYGEEGKIIELLGVDIVKGDEVVSHDLPESMYIDCYYGANEGYVKPKIFVKYVTSGWGDFGLGLELGEVRIDIQFSDYTEEETGIWR